MTTSEGAGTPIWQSAAEEERSDGELSPQATANADRSETAPLTGRIAAPDDPQQLQAEIERTREQLGDTVQELAARVDVKSRARAKAAEARKNAAARAGNVRTQVTSRTVATRQKVISAGASRRDQLRNRASAAGAPVWKATPEPMRRAATKGGNTAREYWMALALAAGAVVFGYIAVRQRNSR